MSDSHPVLHAESNERFRIDANGNHWTTPNNMPHIRVGTTNTPFRNRIVIREVGAFPYPSPEENIFPITVYDERMQREYQITRNEHGGLVLTEVAHVE
jgi:hypothetical protein